MLYHKIGHMFKKIIVSKSVNFILFLIASEVSLDNFFVIVFFF